MTENFDILIVGCGFSGAAAARRLAENGHRVLILEKRDHIAGNMYDFYDENGVLTHRYGPHIFHTSIDSVYDFLHRFSDFFPYEHRVIGYIDDRYVPIPFNFKSAELLFGQEQSSALKNAIKAAFPDRQRVTVPELLACDNDAVRTAGGFIFEKVFLNYTAKQWGMPTEKVDRSVLSRVPVVLGYDDRYFSDSVQCMPTLGYTHLFENMLRHENITVKLSCDAQKFLSVDAKAGRLLFDGEPIDIPVIWTAPADELFGCAFGNLPYRSLDLVFERHEVTSFQPAAVVNYPNTEDFTRITEFKYLTGQSIDGVTTVMKEYPLDYDPKATRGNLPYYPVISPENMELYHSYQNLAAKIPNLFLCGRLAQYKYCNMDVAVSGALTLADTIL
jgi:UDP-galactopyranose mutase